MKKKLSCLMLTLILVISALTGCMGQGVALTLNADGTCTYMVKYLYEKETFQESINQAAGTSPLTTADFTKAEETINGMTYLTFSRQLTFANAETMKMTLTDLTAYINKLKEGSVNAALYSTETINSAPFSEMSLDGSTFTAKATSTSDSMTSSMSSDMAKLSDSAAYAEIGKLNTKALKGYDSVYAYMKSRGLIMDYSITFPANVTESNGTVNGATASWSTDTMPADSRLIAVTAGNPLSADTEAPVISGVKNNGIYKKAVKLQITDNVNVKSVTVNGITIGNTFLKASQSKAYKIMATDANGNTSSVSFRVDSKKPVIKGITNGKKVTKPVTLRFKDNVKVKSVTINGKNVNTRKATVQKKGRYVVKVKDTAGNVAKAVFRIA
ncbi:hypothetical protein [Jutongia sp.]|uniref:LppM family (lipo)protein n=1 Tax=Jutongia sp. TaxID=2944204 RepID=UPI003079B096